MASLQEISSRLMKPAKDLAEFTFPMSEILDDYNEELKNHEGDLRFSEAALVIQNSTNIYDKRVDRLHQETLELNKLIISTDEQNDIEKKSKSERSNNNRKSKIDFGDFELVDFSKTIGKNIDMDPKKEQKKIKFITPRYPQLEKGLYHNFSIDIYDVNGEVIGKKYDYRLNGYMTSSGMLVDELTSAEFYEKETRNQSNSEITENCEDIIQQTSDSFVDEFCDNSRDGGIFSPSNDESGYGTTSNTSCSRINSFNDSAVDHDENITNSPTISTNIQNSTAAKNKESELEIEENSTNINEDENQENSQQEIINSCDILKNDRTRESIETDFGYTSGDAEDLHHIVEEEMTNNPVIIEKITDKKISENLEPRRSKRNLIKNKTHRSFSPIPVTDIPDVLPKKSKTISQNLPCDIVLTKSRVQKRKRRTYAKTNAQKKLKKNLENHNNENTERNKSRKTLLYSPSDNMYDTMKTETEEYQRLFEDRFKNHLHTTYEAFTCENDNLLGFRPISPNIKNIPSTAGSSLSVQEIEIIRNDEENCIQSNDELENRLSPAPEPPPTSSKNIENSSPIIEPIENRLHQFLDTSSSYTPPHSPQDNFDLSDDLDHDDSAEINEMSYQERIEKKMRELRDKFDVDNDKEEETTRWTKVMDSLNAAEKRPIFNVQEYENRIVGALKKTENNQLNFNEIVAQEEPEDIARLFLASLHLANTYDVEIAVSSETSSSNVDLRLLNSNSSDNS